MLVLLLYIIYYIMFEESCVKDKQSFHVDRNLILGIDLQYVMFWKQSIIYITLLCHKIPLKAVETNTVYNIFNITNI